MPRSGGGPFFPGTINLDADTLPGTIRSVIGELVRHGIRKVCAIVGHYENQWIVTEGIDLAMRDHGAAGLRVMRLEYWDFCTDKILQTVCSRRRLSRRRPEHAAVMETSLMLHYHPEMVRLDLIRIFRRRTFQPTTCFRRTATGCRPAAHHFGKGSTKEKGRLMAEHYRTSIAEVVRKELASEIAGERREKKRIKGGRHELFRD